VSRNRGEALIPDEVLVQIFARVDQVALGLAVGVLSGSGLFLATAILLIKGGERIGPTLQLINNYIPGYSVTWPGAFVGALGGLILGFVLGWTVAFIRNAMMMGYVYLNAFWGRLDRFLNDM
jgi:hypothetical protein